MSGPVQMLLMCSGYDEIVLFISPVYFAGAREGVMDFLDPRSERNKELCGFSSKVRLDVM